MYDNLNEAERLEAEKQLKRKQDAELKLKKIKEKSLKLANQQKIITGSLVLGHCENDVDLAWKVLEILNKKLDDGDKKRMKSVIEALEKIIEVGAVAVPSEQQQTNASTVQ